MQWVKLWKRTCQVQLTDWVPVTTTTTLNKTFSCNQNCPCVMYRFTSTLQVYLILMFRVKFLHSGDLEDGWNGRQVERRKQQFTLLVFASAGYLDIFRVKPYTILPHPFI